MKSPRTLFAGIGSPHGDDRVGWLVADALHLIVPSRIEVRQATTPSHLLDWLDDVERLIVCDACRPSRQIAVNRLHRWEWPTLQVAALRSAGSHAFGLPQVLELADRLGTLPQQVIVFGVEGSTFDAFADVSPGVNDAIDEIVRRVANELFHGHAASAGKEAVHHA